MKLLSAVIIIFCSLAAGMVRAQDTNFGAVHEDDFILRDFHFASGETLPELKIHYRTLGTPVRDAQGHVTNAVMALHGTRGAGVNFLRPTFAGELFGPGQLLDAQRYYIILPDGIGHGQSSKPSDGLHAKFPHYAYEDMVQAQYLLLTEGLKIDHLRLMIGTSMGCMHSFMWGEQHVDFVDQMLSLACLHLPISGRNRLWREMVVDGIRTDPAWQQGEYREQPMHALRLAADLWAISGSAPIQMQIEMPDEKRVQSVKDALYSREFAAIDANDLLYQVQSSRDYDPRAGLGRIKARVLWINSGDDFINPAELGIAEREVSKFPHARFILIPASDQTHGHGSYNYAVLWKDYLAQLLSGAII